MHAALIIVVISFSSFMDARHGGGTGIMVGPRALVVFSSFVASFWAALLTGVCISFLGSLTTYEVVPLSDTSPTCWGILLTVVVGRGVHILRPVRKTVHVASRSVVAASCLAASYFLYARTWASCWRGLVGAGMDDVDDFLGKGVVLLP